MLSTFSILTFSIVFFLLPSRTVPQPQSPTEIHIISHSHCDPGWKKTTPDYYTSLVRPILSLTTAYLLSHPTVTYNWVESIYLHMWYTDPSVSQSLKDSFVDLVNKGRIELVLGAWVMNDHACVTFGSVVEQMSLGHSWLRWEIGVVNDGNGGGNGVDEVWLPRSGFTIDPFGVSCVMTKVLHMAGFEYQLMRRIGIEKKLQRRAKKQLEFIWENDILTHVMWDSYSPPFPFQFWLPWPLNPIVTPETVDDWAEIFIDDVNLRLQDFLFSTIEDSQHLFWPFGSDFAFTHPAAIFGNMSLIVDYVNTELRESYIAIYSTVSEYMDQLKEEFNPWDFPKVGDDSSFFVYDDGENSFWSGYFVSQPRLKIEARRGERIARAGEMLYSMVFSSRGKLNASLGIESFDALWVLRDKNGQLQHHDAITGTEKWAVSDFYCNELDDAISGVKSGTATPALSMLVSMSLFSKNLERPFVVWDSRIVGEVQGGSVVGFVLFNSLGWDRKGETVRMSFSTKILPEHLVVSVVDVASGKALPTVAKSVGGGVGVVEASFVVVDSIPAVGWKYFELHVSEKKERELAKKQEKQDVPTFISNAFYEVGFNQSTGKVNRITNKVSNISMDVEIDFYYYESYGSKNPLKQSSGAYVFRPKNPTPDMVSPTAKILSYTTSDIAVEVTQQFSEYLEITVRLSQLDTSPFIEVVLEKVGVMPLDHELVMRLTTGIANNRVVFHDELGFQMMEKEFVEGTDQPVAANFWPTQYCSYIEDANSRMSVLSSKSQSVSSLSPGVMEFMIHRATSYDDGKGVFQPLEDKYVIEGLPLRLLFDKPSASIDPRHYQSFVLNFPLEPFPFIQEYWNLPTLPTDFKKTGSFLQSPLPKQVHLLSTNRIRRDSDDVVIRLANVYESSESPSSVSVDLSALYAQPIQSSVKSTLTLLHDVPKEISSDVVVLPPLDIQTFRSKFVS